MKSLYCDVKSLRIDKQPHCTACSKSAMLSKYRTLKNYLRRKCCEKEQYIRWPAMSNKVENKDQVNCTLFPFSVSFEGKHKVWNVRAKPREGGLVMYFCSVFWGGLDRLVDKFLLSVCQCMQRGALQLHCLPSRVESVQEELWVIAFSCLPN